MCASTVRIDKAEASALSDDELTITAIADIASEERRVNAAYEIRQSIVNALPYDVWCFDQRGVAALIPKCQDRRVQRPGIYVTVVYASDPSVKIDTTELLNVVTESEQTREAYRRAFGEYRHTPTHRGPSRSAVRYSITQEAFENRNCVGFVQQLGLIFCEKDPNKYWHPFSQECLSTNYMAELQGNAAYQVRINDPRQRYASLYTNINGFVYEVQPIRDPALAEGIYLYEYGKLNVNQSAVNIQHYNFEEAFEKIPVFLTVGEAEDYGDVTKRLEADYQFQKDTLSLAKLRYEEEAQHRKSERNLLDHQSDISKIELERKALIERTELEQVKATLEKERDRYRLELERIREQDKLRAEQEKTRLEQERVKLNATQAQREHEIKMEQLLRNHEALERKLQQEIAQASMRDYYERRSYERKDSSEFMKWLPGLALGAAAFMIKGS